MGDVAVKVEGVGKQYRIGEAQRPRYATLRDALTSFAGRQVERLRHPFRKPRREPSTIWALKDVSFEVKRGEVVGIIGRNGAGKSTLLKILSRITEPTEGRVTLHGRVGSLLEVGTGFHLELTGRENIYLNGAILGMKKAEIQRKFDEIVAFAEVGKFIDTPVKHYSSGMHVRLAFAVAAHLEPEILLVDEVLAVGDAAFQKKCLGKMGEVAEGGRTVLFVSHNMPAVAHLCDRCVILAEGSVLAFERTREVIDRYLRLAIGTRSTVSPGVFSLTGRENPYTPSQVLITELRLVGADGAARETFQTGQPLTLEVDVEGLSEFSDGWVGVLFATRSGQRVAGINTGMRHPTFHEPRSRRETFRLTVPELLFTAGHYLVSLVATRGQSRRIDFVEHAGEFSVEAGDVYGTGYRVSSDLGLVVLHASWEVVPQ